MRRTGIWLVLICSIPIVAHGQYDPPVGGEDLHDLYSPLLLSESGPVVGVRGPQADALNPAISATAQRTTIDASYVGLTGFGSPLAGGGWGGHVVNLGLVAPTRAGVASGSLHLVSMPLAGMLWGNSFGLQGSFAKELYPGWSVGAGLRLTAGGQDRFDVGAGLDIGVHRHVGETRGLSDVAWGVSILNVGKWYSPLTSEGPLYTPFTPAGGIAASYQVAEWLRVTGNATATAPGFQNLRAGIGARVELFDSVAIHGGWKLDLRQLLDSEIASRSLIPSFGISASFKADLASEGFAADQGWSQTELTSSLAAAPLYNDVWALAGGINAPLGVIDTVGPVITVEYPEPLVLSPNNDGTQDALLLPVSIQDDRFVIEWQFEVMDSAGSVVRTIRNKDERPENQGFQSFVDALKAVDTGVFVPETIRWDGRGSEGSVVADGRYYFQLRAQDDNGNTAVSPSYQLEVDNTPPAIQIAFESPDGRIFSPNGDGNKDTLGIAQSGTAEQFWTGEVIDSSGDVVRQWDWEDPERFEWDGRDANGNLVADGVYRYRINATDPGGSSAGADLSNIIVDTVVKAIELTVSDSHFSPNGDGVQDMVSIDLSVPGEAGVVSWAMAIRNESGVAVRAFEGDGVPPEVVIFDGLSAAKSALPETRYFAEVEVVYQNGSRPSGQSALMTLDLSAPVADSRADTPIFSPNNDGKLDSVVFFNEASREELWRGEIRNSLGSPVRSFSWTGVPPQRVQWDARQDDGRLAPDGEYSYVLWSTDEAGNTGSTPPVALTIDTSDATIQISAEFGHFSPNADNVRDLQRFFPKVESDVSLRSYAIEVVSSDGTVVRRFDGRSNLVAAREWDGYNQDSRRVGDGVYFARFLAEQTNGVSLEATSATFEVDTLPPSVSLETPVLLFSPDGDGNKDEIRIIQSSSVEDQWEGELRGTLGPVREFLWFGQAPPVVWDGTDSAGNIVEDGFYSYEIRATDRAGNSTSARVASIEIDTRVPRLFVTAGTTAISPNADGILDTVEFELFANVLDGSEGWKLTVETPDGLVVREFAGDTILARQTIEWDGLDGRGVLREGEFIARYAVDYRKGNAARATSSSVVVDVTAPIVEARFDPIPFSPDNDGVDDELRVQLEVQDVSRIHSWSFEILDRNNRYFMDFGGRGTPASQIVWDGRASDGELVISAEDYPYEIRVIDVLGNERVQTGVIPVDILVIRDGDRLKVQISNITFAPNSPQLVLDPSDERGAKNTAILRRLAEIFDKYESYSIRIEGHAVNVTGTDQEERDELQPLSLSRAQSVKDAMVGLGIAERRVTVLGRGGTEPVVPHDDLDNRWKNRRVEFVLIR